MNTLIGQDFAQYPGASISGGFAAGSPGSNLLLMRPQGGAMAAGGVAFSLTLGATYPIGIVHLQGLIGVTSVSISVGGYSATKSTPPNATYGADEWAALGSALFFILPATIFASTVSFTVSGGSPMLIGAVGACEAFQPPFDLATGPSDTVMDLSDVQTVPFGSTFITVRPVRRRKDCAIPYLPDATQSLGGVAPQADYAAAAFRIALIAGKHIPIAIVPFPDDVANIERRAIWGLSSTDQQFTNQFFGFFGTTFQITQLV